MDTEKLRNAAVSGLMEGRIKRKYHDLLIEAADEIDRLSDLQDHYECAAKSGAVPRVSEDGSVWYERPDRR